jgi:hypothetical protein
MLLNANSRSLVSVFFSVFRFLSFSVFRFLSLSGFRFSVFGFSGPQFFSFQFAAVSGFRLSVYSGFARRRTGETQIQLSNRVMNGDGARKRKASGASDDDNETAWSCPACLCTLGVEKGIVPMASTGCGPVAHMICLECYKVMPGLSASDGAARRVSCPLCRATTTFVALQPLLAVLGDDAADRANAEHQAVLRGERVAGVAERPALQFPPPVPMAAPLPAVPGGGASLSEGERHSRRLAMAIDSVQNMLVRWQGDQQLVYYNRVPEWDMDRVRLACRMPGRVALSREQLCSLLTQAAVDLLPQLRELFAAADLYIDVPRVPSRNQTAKYGELCYLAFLVSKFTPAPPPPLPQPKHAKAVDVLPSPSSFLAESPEQMERARRSCGSGTGTGTDASKQFRHRQLYERARCL